MKIDHSAYNPYFQYANKELYWLPMDTYELYQQNLKDNFVLLKENGWIDSKFTYKFNKHGFRSDEFISDNSIVFLGCSSVVGIGVPYEYTWPKLLADELGMSCYNLGIGGASNDSAFRIAYYWLNNLKPKICVFCQTFQERIEIYNTHKGGLVADPAIELPDFYLLNWLENPLNKFLLQEKNTLGIQQLCVQNNTKFILTNREQFVKPLLDLGRDLYHPGIKTHNKFFKSILSKI